MVASTSSSRRALVRLCSLSAAAAILASACAPDAGQRTFVETLGTDTVAIEQYARGVDGFEGDVLVRTPATQVAHYSAQLAGDGTVQRLEVTWRTPPENPEGRPPVSVIYTIMGDSATVEVRGQDTTSTTVAVPPGVIPSVGSPPWSYVEFEQAVMQGMSASGDSVPIHFLTARGRVTQTTLTKPGGDSVSLDYFGSPVIATVDESGRLLSRSGARTTRKTESELVADVDFGALAAEYAARDARGEGLGVASPRDTVTATVDGASLTVEYSRPAMRGREIWGALVPYGEAWRTGANAATHFTTDRELRIGETTVPPGTYTLFSIYTPESARLIINRQTGQWGTVYNMDQDLARVEMRSEGVAEPAERFTIDVTDTAEGGAISLTWDRTRYVVSFSVR